MKVSKPQCIIIGSGNLAVFCAEYLLSQNFSILAAISIDDIFTDCLDKNNIPLIYYSSLQKLLDENEVDYLFSIVNPFLLPSTLTKKAKIAAINFHDSLLPKYAGAFASAWSIINDEKYHGITWHFINEKFDGGDIAIQEKFLIDDIETTASLNTKCFETGKKTFIALIDYALKNDIPRKKQDIQLRSQFLFKTPPPNYGYINWNQKNRSIDLLCRALDFGIYENAFGRSKIAIGESYYIPLEWEISTNSSTGKPGSILEIDPFIKIATKDGFFLIKKLVNSNDEILFSSNLIKLHNLTVGSNLPIIDSIHANKISNQHIKIISNINKTQSKSIKNTIRLENLFINSATRLPNNIALQTSEGSFTYSQLDKMSSALAYTLLNTFSDDNNEIIAIHLAKSCKQIIAVLAILRLGKTFLPLSIDDPINRIQVILNKAKVTAVITESQELAQELNNVKSHLIKNSNYETETCFHIHHNKDYEDVAYIIFTSGSTGIPKGVIMTHQAAVNTILTINKKIDMSQEDKILGISKLNFDLSIYDIFGIFSAGGCLILPSETHLKNPIHWLQLIEEHQITIWNSVPALIDILLQFFQTTHFKPFKYLTKILLSGDWISAFLAKKLLQNINNNVTKLYSLGGATEGGIWSIYFSINQLKPDFKTIPYGKPLANQKIYILDSLLRVQPINTIGEICISGSSMGLSYLNDPIQTYKHFVYHPILGKIYKTGDLGRLCSDGNFQIIGRKDTQIKIHGLRIETNEIEYWIDKYKENIQSKVILNPKLMDLTAFIVTKTSFDPAHLKAFLSTQLPQYMIPSQFIFLNNWPLTSNGKVDMPALVTSIPKKDVRSPAKTEPCTKLELKIKKIWQEILNLTLLPSIEDNFFNLGGDSILSIALAHKLSELGYLVQSDMIFRYPTIKALTQKLKNIKQNLIITKKEPKLYYPTPSQLGMISETFLDKKNHIYIEQVSWITNGKIHHVLYKEAWKYLIKTTDALNVNFQKCPDIRVTFVTPKKIPFSYQKISETADFFEEIQNIAKKDRFRIIKIFDHELFHITLLENPNNKFATVLTFFHAILDGISIGLIIEKLHTIYDALVSGSTLNFKRDDSYKQYLSWMHTENSLNHLNFWKDYVANIENSYLPFYLPENPYARGYLFKTRHIETREISQINLFRLKELAKNSNISSVAIFQALWSYILSYCTNKPEVTSGLVTSGRNVPINILNSIGFFLNLAPLISSINKHDTLEIFCQKIHKQIKEIEARSTIGLINIQKLTAANTPLFDHILIFNKEISVTSEDLLISDLDYYEKTNYPLTITFEIGLKAKIKFTYDKAIFIKEEINKIIDWYIHLIENASFNWSKKLFQLTFTKTSLPSFNKVEHTNLFNKIISASLKNPNKKCICTSNQNFITYNQLVKDTYKVSSSLNKSLSPLLILLPRSIDLVVSMLACLQLGRPYILISLGTPLKRIHSIIDENKIQTILTNQENISLFSTNENILIEEAIENLPYMSLNSSPKIAYINLTSGSTGKPKAVEINHSSLINCLESFTKLWNITVADSFLSITPASFDIFQLEMLLPIINGNTLFLASDEECMNSKKQISLLQKFNPTILQTTPSNWQNLFEAGLKKSSLKTYISGGEVLPTNLASQILSLNPKSFWNVYGPTETTIWSTAKEISHAEQAASIGKPIDNTICLILNENHQELPEGCLGELYIGGAGVAKGYLNAPNENNFINLPNYLGNFYKTGDYAIQRKGELFYKGRRDNQVKIRGHRVELNEIENVINSLEYIEKTKVIFDGINLSAFCIPKKTPTPKMQCSIFYFSFFQYINETGYDFIIQLAQNADQLDFDSLWIPERHFDPMGGLFPNPAVLGANLAATTSKIHIRAGSVVLPLHEPIQIAEDWAMLDNLSGGRVGISFATGWHPNDFVLAPEKFKHRKDILINQIKTIKDLWKGEAISRINGLGEEVAFKIFPSPLQTSLPTWITAAGNEETFKLAGSIGANLLTHLLIQDIDELKDKILIYKEALKENGFNPNEKTITVMVHTYIAKTDAESFKIATPAFENYLKNHLSLFEKILPTRLANPNIDIDEYIQHSAQNFIKTNTLIGSIEHCKKLLGYLQSIGVTEIACLVDFGIEPNLILEGLPLVKELLASSFYSYPDKTKILEELVEILPSAMLPASIHFMEKIPLTSHGKIDNQSLLNLASTFQQTNNNGNTLCFPKNYSQDPVTNKLVEIWTKVLNRNNIGIDDNFFSLGGHSLKAINIIARIEEKLKSEISLREFFKNATIRKLNLLLASKENQHKELYVPENNFTSIPLSINQQSLWALHELKPNSSSYNDSFVISFSPNKIDLDKLELAIQNTCKIHSLTTSTIENNNGKLIQKIFRDKLLYLDRKTSSLSFREEHTLIKQIANKAFDLSKNLSRFSFIQFKDRDILLISFHHIITDGKSFEIFINTLKDNYEGRFVSPLNKGYNEIKIFEDRIKKERSLDYEELCKEAGILETLQHINYKHSSRPNKLSDQGNVISLLYNNKNYYDIIKNINKLDTTIFIYFFTVLSLSLKPFIENESIVIGWPYVNREILEEKTIFAPLVNLLPTIVTVELNQTYDEYLKKVTGDILNTMKYSEIPFSKHVEFSKPGRSLSYHPLCQIVLNSVDIRKFPGEISGIKQTLEMHDFGISRYDLELQVIHDNSQIELRFILNSDIFSESFTKEYIYTFQTILSKILTTSNESIESILNFNPFNNFLDKFSEIIQEKHRINLEFDYSKESTVVRYNRNKTEKLHSDLLNNWRFIYNNLYKLDPSPYAGWINSQTLTPYSKEEMNEWVIDTVTQIKELSPVKILEVGAGSGLLIEKLLNIVELYHATDFSEIAIYNLKQNFSSKLICTVKEANKISEIATDENFDLVIVNSVIQYFPDIIYFIEALNSWISKIQNGRIFLGDVINFDMLMDKNKNKPDEILKLISNNELSISPSFMYNLKNYVPFITDVKIAKKQGKFATEMNEYRYNCIIFVDKKHKSSTTSIDFHSLYLDIIFNKLSEIFPLKNFNKQTQKDNIQFQTIKAKLIKIWQTILLNDDISIDSTFFELGGNSISGLQMIVRARQDGLEITPQEFYENQTINLLVKLLMLKTTHKNPDSNSLDTQPFSLSPIQAWLVNQGLENIHHWNQAFLFRIKTSVTFEFIKNKFTYLLNFYDIFKIKFNNDLITQNYYDNSSCYSFSHLDLSHSSNKIKEMLDYAEKFQRSLHLFKGDLIKIILFDLGEELGQRLLIIAHNLIMDGVSWRIILDDLIYLWDNQEPNFSKTSSYKNWVISLQNFIQSEKSNSAKEFWNRKSKLLPPLPKHYISNNLNLFLYQQNERLVLNKEKVNFHINEDLFLGCFIFAYANIFNEENIYIDIESHGRQIFENTLDMSRTLGWFTSIYPVLFTSPEGPFSPKFLSTISEIKNEFTNYGFLFMAIKHFGLNDKLTKPIKKIGPPNIVFNYFGEISQSFQNHKYFEMAEEELGFYHDEKNERPYILHFNVANLSDKIILELRYSYKLFDKEKIQELMRIIEKTLTTTVIQPVEEKV